MANLLCPHCENEWDYEGFEKNPPCPECGEKVEVRRNINWENSGSYFAKIYSKK